MTIDAPANAALRAFRNIVQRRVSARRFEPGKDVPNHVWRDILQMTLTSPSGFNLQPTHVLLLRSPAIKSALSRHAMLGLGNQYRAVDASGIAVVCADLEPSKRMARIYDLERQSGAREDGYLSVFRVASTFLTGESSNARLAPFFKGMFADALSAVQPMPTMENVESWSYKNAGIVAQTYTMAATAHGLSTCMMEGYDARRAKEILRIPDRYGVPLMIATGYEYGAPPVTHADVFEQDERQNQTEFDANDDKVLSSSLQSLQRRTPRLDMKEVFFGDTFGEELDLLRPMTPGSKDDKQRVA